MIEDADILASRAVVPQFYRAPYPDRLPDGKKVMEFQLAGPEYALARNHCLIGDEPGMTKTAQAIIIGNAIGAKHTLVVCPASLRLNWEREIWTWSTVPNVTTYPILKSSDGVSHVHSYVIISYALLTNPNIVSALLAHRWDHLILDEAHAIKDPKGNIRTKAICAPDRLPSVVGRITLCSGTILPNQPSECYNAIRLCRWDAIGKASLEDFREFYYGLGEGMVRGPVWDHERQAFISKVHWSDQVRNEPRNLEDLQYRLRKHVMVRRLKAQVMHELPNKTWHPFPLEITSEIRKALKHPGWSQAEQLYEMDASSFNHGIPIDGAISSARRILGEAKAPAVADYIDDLIDSGVGKLVVAAWHHSVLDFLRAKLSHHGLVYMDGSTSAVAKQGAVDAFQKNPKIKIILGQKQPLGEGWTLTEAQDVVDAEFDWVPSRNGQLFDRVHRMGQRGDHVICHVPVVPGTLDERILATAIRKDQHIYKALDAVA